MTNQYMQYCPDSKKKNIYIVKIWIAARDYTTQILRITWLVQTIRCTKKWQSHVAVNLRLQSEQLLLFIF